MYDDYTRTTDSCTIFIVDELDNRPFVEIEIFEIKIKALLDSGSNVTLMSSRLYRKLKLRYRCPLPTSIVLKAANGKPLKVIGQVDLPFSFNNHTKVISTLIVENMTTKCICGMDFWSTFGIVPEIRQCAMMFLEDDFEKDNLEEASLNRAQLGEIESVKKSFKDVSMDALECTTLTEHRIVIREEDRNKIPVCKYPYPMNPLKLRKVWAEIDRLLSLKIIEEADSDWSLNIVAVNKPDNSVRLCLDARPLNERTVRDAYPLPHPGRILGSLPKATFLSTIDLKEAFLQVPLARECRKYTAFSIPGKGMYQFTRLPYGLINSPATLARLMDRVLGKGSLEPHVFVYLDDIIVVTETFEEHVHLLREVAGRLAKTNLTVNLNKCKFGVQELSFLGYLLTNEGLKINPEKIRPILEFEKPLSLTKLRRFLGMTNYYRRFIPLFSQISAPLTEMLKSKSKTLVWSSTAEQSFRSLKEKLVTPPILASPDFDREFTLQTDASDTAIAAVLTQEFEDGEKVIEYYSHKLTTPQRNYHATEKEGLAVILAIEHFRGYLEGYHFKLITDNSAITWIQKSKWKIGSRLSRWSLQLQTYNMTIIHRKGSENVVPDALSRDVSTISAESKSDSYNLLKNKVQNKPDEYADFKISENKLYKYVSNSDQIEDYRFQWKLIPTPVCRETIILETHESLLHAGFEKTLYHIKLRYYWPKMANAVKTVIQNCTKCKEIKHPSKAVAPEMGKMLNVKSPWRIISIDFIGPLPRSRSGNQHLLVVLDIFSKWVMLHPVRKIQSSQVCSILRNYWFARNGTPEVLLSDNASTFTSKEFKSFLDEFKVHHWLRSRYHSQANPVERVNRSINAAIRAYVKDDQRTWDDRISDVERILNITKHSSTGFSPYFVIHGHEMAMSGIDFDNPCAKENPVGNLQEGQIKLKRIHDIVTNNLEKSYNVSKQHYNLRHRTFSKPFKENQLVYRRNQKLSNALDGYNAKLGRQYLPCYILKKHGSSSYELADLAGKNLGIWPANMLKS